MDPLPILIATGGVVLVIGVVYFAAGVGGARLLDLDDVRRRIHADLPGFRPEQIFLARDGQAALAMPAVGDTLVALYVFGDMINIRQLPPSDLARIDQDGDRLILRVRDFSHPRIVLDAEPDLIRSWVPMLRDLAGGD